MDSLLLQIWRESSQHIEIEESIDRIARLVATELPVDMLIVRRIDVPLQRVESVGIGVARRGSSVPERTRTECTPTQMAALVEWCRKSGVVHGPVPSTHSILAVVAPPDLEGDCLAGALVRADQALGVLLLVARAPRHFEAKHAAVARALLDPIAVAMANDSRIHELARLREAVEADNRALLSRLDRVAVSEAIVGSETGLRHVMERVDQVAPTEAPVLVFGETGTGKEVLARAIHARSRRAAGPVVRVNCGALPPGLIDSELFGHERGSFTGAMNVRHGWFERADGGTLFLDEVGELPLDAQVRLLRILQDGTFERVGGQKPLRVDVRIVAATHRDLHDMVVSGTFREDLWYRISVFPIHLPPLRDRLEDIPALASHFAWRAGKRLGGSPLSLAPVDVDLLVSYSWPGNVRELGAVIERAAILGNGRELQIAAALGTGGRRVQRQPARERYIAAAPEPQEIITLDAAMARHIELALRATRGCIEGPDGAAAKLGINPHTLRGRMRKLGIDWSRFRRTAV